MQPNPSVSQRGSLVYQSIVKLPYLAGLIRISLAVMLAMVVGVFVTPSAARADTTVTTASWNFVTGWGCVLDMGHKKTQQSDGWEVHDAVSTTPSTGACSPDGQKPRTLTRIECFNQANVAVNNSPTSVYQGYSASVSNVPLNAYSYCDSIHRITYNGMQAPSNWGNITFKLRVFASNAVQVWRCTDAGTCVQAA